MRESGTVTVRTSIMMSTAWNGSANVTLYLNGTSIGTASWTANASNSTKTIQVTGVSVSVGDLVHIGLSGFAMMLADSYSYVEVVP